MSISFLGLDPNMCPGIKAITVNARATGTLSEEQKQEIVRLGSRFSPVYDMVTNAVPVTVELSS